MEKKTKVQLGVIGACAVMLVGGSIAATSGSDKNESSVPTSSIVQSYDDDTPKIDVAKLTGVKTAQDIAVILDECKYNTDLSAAVGKELTFTASVRKYHNSTNTVTIVTSAPTISITAIFDDSETRNITGDIELKGTITDITLSGMTLENCELLSGGELPPETTATTTAATSQEPEITTTAATTTTQPKDIVYVSVTGKYHRKPDCSGMDEYTEMSKEEAIAAGHDACGRCY